MDCARHKQIYMCLPLPPVRTHHPRRFRKNYKTVGMAPLLIEIYIVGWANLIFSVIFHGHMVRHNNYPLFFIGLRF